MCTEIQRADPGPARRYNSELTWDAADRVRDPGALEIDEEGFLERAMAWLNPNHLLFMQSFQNVEELIQ